MLEIHFTMAPLALYRRSCLIKTPSTNKTRCTVQCCYFCAKAYKYQQAHADIDISNQSKLHTCQTHLLVAVHRLNWSLLQRLSMHNRVVFKLAFKTEQQIQQAAHLWRK